MHNVAPEYDFTSIDGIRHTVWALPDEYNDEIISEMDKVNNLYIADGTTVLQVRAGTKG